MQPLDTGLEGALLPGLHDVGLELRLDLEVDLLDAGWVDPAVLQQPLEREPRDLAADTVESGQHHSAGGVVDDEVDPRERLQHADVASLAADDAALHVIG